MENHDPELLKIIESLGQCLHNSKPKDPGLVHARRSIMGQAIQVLRENGKDERWYSSELVEKVIELRVVSGAFISDYRLQRALQAMKLSEVNFSLNGYQHPNVGIFSNTLERFYHSRETANDGADDNYTIRSSFSSTTFFYVAKTMLLWCSVAAKDLAKIIDLLYEGGLHTYAWDVLRFLGFDPLTGKHRLDSKTTKKHKRRQVIVQEELDDDDGTTEGTIPERPAESPGDH